MVVAIMTLISELLVVLTQAVAVDHPPSLMATAASTLRLVKCPQTTMAQFAQVEDRAVAVHTSLMAM